MRILVTGHEGFIGKNMLAWLHQEEGWHVDGYEWHPIERPDVREYDQVIHLGAIADMGYKDIDQILKQNLEFSQWLFNDCNHHGVNMHAALVGKRGFSDKRLLVFKAHITDFTDKMRDMGQFF